MTKVKKPTITSVQVAEIANIFKGYIFSTKDFIGNFSEIYPDEWARIVEHYGAGGVGANTHFSSFSRVAHTLATEARANNLIKLPYFPAPVGWGSPVIRYWSVDKSYQDKVNDLEEFSNAPEIPEGSLTQILVNRYERSKEARKSCISHWGTACTVCKVDFGKRYGALGEGFIHVHHLVPIHTVKQEYKIDPVKDLRPVCPNCHSMLHRTKTVLSIGELQDIFKNNNQA